MKLPVDISAWGEQPPHFIQLLANLVTDSGSREAAAKTLSISRTSVSLLLSNRYTGGTGDMEQLIIKELGQVPCPELGQISNAKCQKMRKAPFPSHNPSKIQLWRACWVCEHNPQSDRYQGKQS